MIHRPYKIITKPISYSNAEEGKLFGNGFLNFQYRGHDFFFVTFSYRLYVQENKYKYVFTDFVVKEIYQMIRKESKINSWPVEEFCQRKKYEASDVVFTTKINDLKHQLKLAMSGEL